MVFCKANLEKKKKNSVAMFWEIMLNNKVVLVQISITVIKTFTSYLGEEGVYFNLHFHITIRLKESRHVLKAESWSHELEQKRSCLQACTS